MRLLHTSDWHLGKRLEGKSRLSEQRAVLEELVRVCDEQRVDVILVAGDIFDTANPPAEAEELFYSYAVRLAAGRHLVAVAGNHDNAERLSAPGDIARVCNIILAGGMDHSRITRGEVTGGNGWIRIARGGETLNLALLPYPSPSRMSGLGFQQESEKYSEDAASWIATCCACFTDDGLNCLMSHLYMLGTVKSDEAELGSAALLPAAVLPERAGYVALGHIHKPQKVSGRANAYYSGSILKYSFDDTSDKFFNLVELSRAGATLTKLPIRAGKTPVRLTVHGFEEAIAALSAHADDWVQLMYDSPQPLSAAKYAALKAHENFCNLVNVFRAPAKQGGAPYKVRTDKELFCDFYMREKGEQPSEELVNMFLAAVNGETL